MTTQVISTPVIRLQRPLKPTWDRLFFAGMAVILWATVLVGFSKTYFMAGMVRAPLPNVLIHIHGAAFTAWMLLLVVQIAFISTRRLHWHKRLGLAGFGLAILMVVLGVLAATDAMRRGAGPLGLDAKTFYIVPISDMLVFSTLVFFAYRLRFKPAAHKRLILIASIALMDAAVGRWPLPYFQAHPPMQDLVPFGFLFVLMAYDLLSLRRVQWSTLWASIFLIAVHLVRVPLGLTPTWHAFATWMGRTWIGRV